MGETILKKQTVSPFQMLIVENKSVNKRDLALGKFLYNKNITENIIHWIRSGHSQIYKSVLFIKLII